MGEEAVDGGGAAGGGGAVGGVVEEEERLEGAPLPALRREIGVFAGRALL